MNKTDQTQRICWAVDLGVIAYAPACELQRKLVQAHKVNAVPDVLLICEHPHVITLGRNGKREHLRAGSRVLDQMRVEFHDTDRGGDITYHGPGQIIAYPILDLTAHRRDVRWYVEQLEETMIRASAAFGIAGHRREGAHGVWVDTPAGEEKLAALGVHLSRWVTSHGFAYNVSTDLRYFDLIVPCGISGKCATSLEKLLGRTVSREQALAHLLEQFGNVFGVETVSMSRPELEKALANIPLQRVAPYDSTIQASISREAVSREATR
ncbi:MAG TPA: lipoyl(octanoyl) transferase LipB [Candidatus Acidoferrales bacterium]|nr:lipoyl(octanoyl) transferase LipB [Candidatus Acidoferrales bacterium]